MEKKKLGRLSFFLAPTAAALCACGSDPYAGISNPSDGDIATSIAPGTTVRDGGAADAATNVEDITVMLAAPRQLDLVFMIDNSPSMAAKQAKLNAQFPRLIDALKDPSDGTLPDLRIAIIDSDLGTGGAYSAGACGPNPSNGMSLHGDQGKFQMRGASGCGVTDPSALWLEYTGGQPVNYTGDISQVFACLATNLGTMGCGEEHSLEAFAWALAKSGVGNDAQHAMLRPGAYLGLIFVTDEDDCSATDEGMFGDMSGLGAEAPSLRCATRAHACSGRNLSSPPPGYPTTAAFSADYTTCAARTDACPDASSASPTDTSVPTTCSPLTDISVLAQQLKALKSNPYQLLVAGIFGVPIAGQNIPYTIDLVPNPNVLDTAHPQIYDYWPICYDPNHFSASDATTYNAGDAAWGATGGLRESAFIDAFGDNGLKFSVCATDFSAAMAQIGRTVPKKQQSLCSTARLRDVDLTTPGLQPDCSVQYSVFSADASGNVVHTDVSPALAMCPIGASAGNVAADCWQLTVDPTRCPTTGESFTILRTAAELAAGTPAPGTAAHLRCQICTDSTSPGCSG